uniref:Hypothetical chloroplast RF15 n=1 Tax=Liparis japonica TaxID=327328 RepID=A0A6M4RJC0_9ASPA|nr:hypothetical chloroplast RF15 [Liparis japonica]QJS35521.1 hypothetical chloroplast RF15 [Liparis japonica]
MLIVLFRSKDIHGAGSSYSDIHDQEVLDFLALKGEGRLECQQTSIIEFTRPDSTHFGTFPG